MSREFAFDFLVLTPPGFPDASLAIAGSRAGAIGVLNLDALPPREALDEVAGHPDVQSVRVIELPPAGQLPTWLRA